MTEKLALSEFMYETVAIGAANQLPVSSVCNAKCLFCSNRMNPFPIRRIGFRAMDDVRKGIALLSADGRAEIRIGDSLPGRISEGEALLHPEILTILKWIRNKAPGRTIQVNTNGILLTQDFIGKLVDYKPMKFTISYHSDNKENWCRIFNLREEHYRIARNAFFQLRMKEFMVEAALVPLPRLVGYEDLENTLKALRCYTNKIIVYPPGFSRIADDGLVDILDTDYRELSSFFSGMRRKYHLDIDLHADPFKPIDFNPFQFMQRSFHRKFKHVLWMFSEAAYGRAKKILEAHLPFVPNDHYGVKVKNRTYGGNIVAAGLLMVDDFERALKGALRKFQRRNVRIDLIVLPQVAFDRYGDDLTGRSHAELSEKYGLPVWLG